MKKAKKMPRIPIPKTSEANHDVSLPVNRIEVEAARKIGGEVSKLEDEELHRFLAYLMPQLEPLRQACEYNWLIQAVLVTLASFHLYNSKHADEISTVTKIPLASLDLLIPIVLSYLLIRLGYLANAYLFIRDGIISLLKQFSKRPPEFDGPHAEKMLRANSIVELFGLEFKKENRNWSNLALGILPLVVGAVFALNHALVFLYLGRLAGHRRSVSIPIAAGLIILIGSCYRHFMTKAPRLGGKLLAWIAIGLAAPLFVLMHWTIYRSLF
jgi:hypothetical protein